MDSGIEREAPSHAETEAGTLTAEVPPEETEDVLTGARSVVREILDRLRQGRHRPTAELGLR